MWNRCEVALTSWFDLYQSADVEDEDDKERKGVPENLLIAALLDPRLNKVTKDLLYQKEWEKGMRLVTVLFIESAQQMRLFSEEKERKEQEKNKSSSDASDEEVLDDENTNGVAANDFLRGMFSFGAMGPAASNSNVKDPVDEKERKRRADLEKQWENAWSNSGGSRKHRSPTTNPTYEDIEAGAVASRDFFTSEVPNFVTQFNKSPSNFVKKSDPRKRQKLGISTIKNIASPPVVLDNEKCKIGSMNFDVPYTFEHTDIMSWILSFGESNPLLRNVLLVNICQQPSNALIERFFSLVSGIANTRNMNLKNEKIEMRAVAAANIDLMNTFLEEFEEETREREREEMESSRGMYKRKRSFD